MHAGTLRGHSCVCKVRNLFSIGMIKSIKSCYYYIFQIIHNTFLTANVYLCNDVHTASQSVENTKNQDKTPIMKKRLLVMMACAMLAVPSVLGKSLVLTLTDGTLVYYLLGSDVNPMMHLSKEGIRISADTYTFGNLKNFYISPTDDPNGIEQVLTNAHISYSGNMLVCTGKENDEVQVYTTVGTPVQANIKVMGDKILVDLNQLPQGTYVVKMGQSSLKVMKKDER